MPTSDFSNKTYNPGDGEKRKSYPNNNNKSSEKDQMIGLNDKFVQIIDKVKSLEDDKKKLAKKLELLKKQDDYAANIEDLVRQQKNELERKIDSLLLEKDKLDDELDRVQKEKDDNKKRYEDEIVKKQEAEQDFILAKEDVDRGHLAFVDDALKLEKLNRDVEFLRPCFEEEIRELQSLIKNDRVVLPENNKRSLDMDDIIKSVEDQYAKLAARAREETESWNQKKMKDMVSSAAQQQENLREMKKDVADLKRFIQTLNRDLEALKRKEANLRKEIDDLRKEGDENMEKARGDIKLMEEALNKNKQVLAEKIKEHQELLNLKLSLDIEIATYNKLLEGEENRMREYAYNADY
ncbi:intermediate filament protein ON3 [Kryptolebias marmoratus]|uniref:Keratin, type II cytoskeletal 8 n=1 Tax=Kryptolebias marmoratus TaxID=37003 RepID=A0A3Q2ZL64_KRYMA|nr:intermediate filament protein ON3 [Kryptolebias marmoratus]